MKLYQILKWYSQFEFLWEGAKRIIENDTEVLIPSRYNAKLSHPKVYSK